MQNVFLWPGVKFLSVPESLWFTNRNTVYLSSLLNNQPSEVLFCLCAISKTLNSLHLPRPLFLLISKKLKHNLILVLRLKPVVLKTAKSREMKFLADLWEKWMSRWQNKCELLRTFQKSLFFFFFCPTQLVNILGLIKFFCSSSEFNFGSICQSHNHISQECHLATGQIHYHKHRRCSWITFLTTANVCMQWAWQT